MSNPEALTIKTLPPDPNEPTERQLSQAGKLYDTLSPPNLQGDLCKLADNDDTVGLYITEATRTPLLKPEEETDLAMIMDQGKKAGERLTSGQYKSQQKAALMADIEVGLAAKDYMVQANLRLAIGVARKYCSCGVPFLDLIQEGNVGLVRAAQQFDVTRGHKFSTYATWWVVKYIKLALRKQGRLIPPSEPVLAAMNQIGRARQLLLQTLHTEPSDDQLYEKTGITPKRIKWARRAAQPIIDLESPAGTDTTVGELIENGNDLKPEVATETTILRDHLEFIMDNLTPTEARTLQIRHGFKGDQPLTLEKVGNKFGITRQAVQQNEKRTYKKIRKKYAFLLADAL